MKRSSAEASRAATPERFDAGDAVLILGAGLAGLFLALKLAPRRALVVAPQRKTSAGAAPHAEIIEEYKGACDIVVAGVGD